MGLFDKETETQTRKRGSESMTGSSTSTTRTAARSKSENQMLQMLQQLSSGAAGQMGDMSGLAAGELPELSPDMLAMLQDIADQMFSREKSSADMTFEEGLLQSGNRAAASGQSGSTDEAVFRAIAGRERGKSVSDAKSRSEEFLSRQQIALPQQQAQQALSANSLLFNMATQPAGMALDNRLRERLANLTQTSNSRQDRKYNEFSQNNTTESGGLGDLLSLGTNLMSMFGGGDIFSQLFGGGGDLPLTGSTGSTQFSSPIGPTLSGSPQGSPIIPPVQGPYF